MNFKTKIALACGLSASLVVVGSLTPTITYAVQNTKNEPEVKDDYEYTDADVVDTKTNLLVNYDRYPVPKSADYHEDFNVLEKVAEIESSSKSNKDKVYDLLSVGTALNITLVNWPYIINELKNRELSIASQIADQEEFKQLNDLYNSLHKEYAVAEILNKETTALNDSILANHDEQSRPEIAKLRARNLLKYEIESAKKTHDQLEQVANFTLNKEASLNSYYYEGNNRNSFITIDELNEKGELFVGNDISSYLSSLAINKNANEDAFNLIQYTSYSLNDTEFTLYARIESFDYEKSEGNFDIAIDYGMIETKYNALPNREDFMIWYSDYKDVPQNQQTSIFSDEEEKKNPLKYHMLLSNEIIDEFARDWFADSDYQISFIQDNDHGFDTVRKIVEEKGGLSHKFTMEEMSTFMTLPNGVKIDNTSLPGINLNMVISGMDATTNKIDYKLFLTFDFAPDVTTQSEEYQTVVAVSKKAVEDLFKTYKNIVDTVAVFKDWTYERNIGWPFDVIVRQNLLQWTMNVLGALAVALSVILIVNSVHLLRNPAYWLIYWAAIATMILIGVAGATAAAISTLTSIYNFDNVFVWKGENYSRNNYWSNISDILAKMKDDHKDNIDNFVDNMFSTVIENKDKMERLRINPNPTMAEIDEMVRIFGNYEKPTSNDSKTWTLGQKSYAINNWMMDLMKSDTSKYDWMIHAKYGIDNPAHDIIKEVPCAIVANQEALASETMFKVIPILLMTETISATLGLVAFDILTIMNAGWYQKEWLKKWLPTFIKCILLQLSFGFTSGTFIRIFSIFDFKNASDNLETTCRKYSSSKLLGSVVLTTIVLGLSVLYSAVSFKISFSLADFAQILYLAVIYLQTATYVAMFSNFRY